MWYIFRSTDVGTCAQELKPCQKLSLCFPVLPLGQRLSLHKRDAAHGISACSQASGELHFYLGVGVLMRRRLFVVVAMFRRIVQPCVFVVGYPGRIFRVVASIKKDVWAKRLSFSTILHVRKIFSSCTVAYSIVRLCWKLQFWLLVFFSSAFQIASQPRRREKKRRLGKAFVHACFARKLILLSCFWS